jgi:EasF-like predicted methyltransferase
LSAVPLGTFSHVTCYGLHGTYDDGLAWLTRPDIKARTKCILTLGSSTGNFSRDEAADFLKGFGQVLNTSDSMLVGLDACQEKERVFAAYNDREGLTEVFYRNGLSNANSLLGYEAFKQDAWDLVGVYNEYAGRHEAYFSPVKDVHLKGVSLRQGERVLLEKACKYSLGQSEALWHAAGLNRVASFGNQTSDYRKSALLTCCFGLWESVRHLSGASSVLRSSSFF